MTQSPSGQVSILHGDVLDRLRTIADDSIQCVVTSPPYWRLRDYGVDGQIGLEPTFEEFLDRLVAVFAEVRRVLRPNGVCWVNMGDSYATASSGQAQGGLKASSDVFSPRANPRLHHRNADQKICPKRHQAVGFRPKEIIGQPWRLAFALQSSGWLLRQDIVWHKTQPMPESVRDRCTKAHEYLFLLTKSSDYFWDFKASREPVSGTSHPRGKGVHPKAVSGWASGSGSHSAIAHAKPGQMKTVKPKSNPSFSAAISGLVSTRNWRSVWSIPTQAFRGAHFATFPERLALRCIVAGSRPGDTVLDPFGGAGTTAKVAASVGRHCVLIELSSESVQIAKARLGFPTSATLAPELVRTSIQGDLL
jgi:DNA modification methylase